jgi:CMP-N,N'-diacetyllegionaminic acid synthase
MSSARAIALIPARGGSKSIPGKNLALVLGKPLIHYTIQAARESRLSPEIRVSTDSAEIAGTCRALEAEVIMRPAELAGDETPMAPVIRHALEALGTRFEFLLLLQPTSPLRRAEDIDAAFDLLESKGGDAVISVTEAENKVLKYFVQDGKGHLRGVRDDKSPFLRRQDLPPVFRPNGAIYLYRTQALAGGDVMLPARTLPYVMPEERSIDIDSREDLETVARILSRKGFQ